MKVLWVGSSSTFYHDMPKQMERLLNEKAGLGQFGCHLVGRGGTLINVYLDPEFHKGNSYGLNKEAAETVLQHIEKGGYRYVVLQCGVVNLKKSGSANHTRGNDGFGEEHLDTYSKAAKEAGATPIFYEQGWERETDGEKYAKAENGMRVLFDAAVRNDAKIAPCRTVWKRIWKEKPGLELQDLPDRTHPGALGLYVNMCCFYAALTGKSPVGLPATYLVSPLVESAGHSKRGPAESKTLDGDLAAYFQAVAWEEYVRLDDRRRETRVRVAGADGKH